MVADLRDDLRTDTRTFLVLEWGLRLKVRCRHVVRMQDCDVAVFRDRTQGWVVSDGPDS
jgi:hypothetical protein